MKNLRNLMPLSAVAITICLTACHRNPALLVTPDELAIAINAYEPPDMLSISHAVTCGEMAATSDPTINNEYYRKDCADYFQKLAIFLGKQQAALQHMTASDAKSADTWKHYFTSRRAHGRGSWVKAIGISP